MFFSIYTLGCKLNQLETEAITDAFHKNGFTFVKNGSPGAALLIVNTCTVTSMAEQKARRLIRKLLNGNPGACLIVTGCYAQVEKASIERQFPERVFVIPGDKKDALLDLPAFLAGAAGTADSFSGMQELLRSWQTGDVSVDGAFRFMPEKFAFHSRGFLKIQDGCNNRCTYCRVCLARGKSRSLEAGEVLERLKSHERRGLGEAVLTGVNISQYNDSGMALPELLNFLLNGTEGIRLRLSSIEPECLNDDLIRILSHERIRPHIHLSLQSGSAAILARMGRSYVPADVEKAVEKFRSVRDDPFLACDIIAGFPGETRAEFDVTKAFCEKLKLAWIHAFPFSRRPGTAAYDFPERVSEREAKERVEQLTALAVNGRGEYLERWKGREVEAIVETGKAAPDAFVPGISENYLKLRIACGEGQRPTPGSLIRCRITAEAPKDPCFDACAEKINS